MPFSAKWNHKSSIHIGFIVFNGAVTNFFCQECMFWGCKTCKPQIPTLFAQAQRQSNLTTPNENIHETLTESLNAIENRLETKLDAKLEATVKAIQESIQPIRQKVSEIIENSVSVNMSKAWSETLFGEQSESFPALETLSTKMPPSNPNWHGKKPSKKLQLNKKKKTRTEKTYLKMSSYTVHQSHTTHQPKTELNMILN